MKTTIRIPTNKDYAFIQVELDNGEVLTQERAKEIVDAYYLTSQEYWKETKDKEVKVATKVAITNEANDLANNIDKAMNLEALEQLEDFIKKIDGTKVQEILIKKYNDKKIKLIEGK